MKFIGLFKGEFKILETIDSSQLGELDADFAWIDIDRIDPKTEMGLKKLGLESVGQFGLPVVSFSANFDLIRVNYFEDQIKRELEIYVLDDYLITVHQGRDPVCDGVMASVNELLVSGEFSFQQLLYNLLSVVLERHEMHLKAVQESLRTVSMQLKKGISSVAYISQLNEDSRNMFLVFSGTKSQIADILLSTAPIRGLEKTEQFSELYAHANTLVIEAESLLDTTNHYTTELITFMWGQLDRVKRLALGLSIFAMLVAIAVLLRQLFPEKLFGLNSIYLVVFLIIAGVIGLVSAQRGLKLTL